MALADADDNALLDRGHPRQGSLEIVELLTDSTPLPTNKLGPRSLPLRPPCESTAEIPNTLLLPTTM